MPTDSTKHEQKRRVDVDGDISSSTNAEESKDNNSPVRSRPRILYQTLQSGLCTLKVNLYYFGSAGKIESGTRAGEMREYLDLTAFRATPAIEWKALFQTKDPMPMSSCYLAKSGRDSFVFFAVTFQQLCQLHQSMSQESRHFGTIVLNNAPCHQYFDLDCSIKSQGVDIYDKVKDRTDDIIEEWFRYWSSFFKDEVARGKRGIDLSVTQIEVANCDGKLSIHIHVVSEAFLSVAHHKAAVLAFSQWLKDNAPESLLLQVLDLTVYTQHRNMRMVGSCKPGRQTLAVYDYDNKQALPLNTISEKHLFNGLISYAFSLHADHQPMTFESNLAKGRKHKAATDIAINVKKPRMAQHCSRRDEIAEAVKAYGFEIVGEMDTNGFFECVQPPDGRTCFFRDDDGQPLHHKRNRAKCWVNEHGVWIGCHSGKCSEKRLSLLPNEDQVDPVEQKEGQQQGDAGGDDEKQAPAEQHDVVFRPLLQDDRPELSRMLQIHAEWSRTHKADLKRATKASNNSDQKIAKKGKRTLAKLHALLDLDLVRYLNKYLMAIVRGGKAIIISEIVAMNKRTMSYSYQHSMWALNEFKQVHINWRLPSIATPITTIWSTHPDRRQVDNIVFRPQSDNFVDTCKFPDFNLYKGPGISKAQAADWAEHNPDWRQQLEPLLSHIHSIWCSDSIVLITYVTGWLAHVLQKPHEKTGTAIVLKSEEGAGKTVVVDKIGAIVGADHYFPVHDPDDVLGKYTHQLKACILLSMDEALWGGDKANAEGLKKLITQPTHSVHEKYLSSVTVDSYVNVVFSTNNDWAAPAGRTDRRLMCIDVSNKYAGIQSAETKAYFDKVRAVPNEALAHYLYTYDISQYNPREIVATDLQRDQKMRSLEPLYKWWHAQLVSGEVMCSHWTIEGDTAAEDRIRPIIRNNVGDAWTLPHYKEFVYESYAQFTRRNRQFAVDGALFWKDVKKLMPPNSLIEKRYNQVKAGRKPRIVYLPNLEECRQHWRTNVVRDEDWTFEVELIEEAQ